MAPEPDFTDLLHIEQGFCYPDWNAVAARIEKELQQAEWSQAWASVSRAWVQRNSSQLGGNYRVYETPNFLVLSDASITVVRHACRSFEDGLKHITTILKDVACINGSGKQVVFMLADLDDYYRYISYFYPDGEHPMNGGVCLSSSGYVHYAVPITDDLSYRSTLIHELTHGLLLHLPLPVWLNEAVAMKMEHVICASDVFYFDQEVREKHLSYWDLETIQQFWSGESWNIPGDSFELSYNLAYLLWEKIESHLRVSRQTMLEFISKADRADGGEKACLDMFSVSLGHLLGPYLGSGEWGPQPVKWPPERQSSTT